MYNAFFISKNSYEINLEKLGNNVDREVDLWYILRCTIVEYYVLEIVQK